LKFGADDYITKPFNIKIVLKRIGVILNRGNRNQENTFKIRDLIIDFDNRMIKKNNNIIYLTPTEFDLLNIFIKNKNMILTREILLEKLWDNKENFVDEHTLTLNISRLRSKLDDKNDKYIKTIYGIGYKFLEE
jgi:DNA-binding response OmpR family regulator